jgi:misacylated tRNA(Ala) deacylase
LAEREFNWITFGWNLGPEKSYVEFESILPDAEKAKQLEVLVNEYIRQGHSVEVDMNELVVDSERPDTLPADINAGVLRKIKIGDTPAGPCCGTHVSNTRELQMIKFLCIEKCRNKNARVWFVVGNRVLKTFEESIQRDISLNKLLNAGPELFVERVVKILDQRKEHMKKVKQLEKDMKLLSIAKDKSAESA